MKKHRIGLLLGDAAGVGPEIVAKLLTSPELHDKFKVLVIGDARVLESGLSVTGRELKYYCVSGASEIDWDQAEVPVYDLKDLDPARVQVGVGSAYCGASDISMILTACALCAEGTISGFCFAPLNKSNMKLAGMRFASESELMADYFGVHAGYGEVNAIGDLVTVRVTSHIPLKDVSTSLSVENISSTIQFGNMICRQLGKQSPRIAVSGLNPHNGEGGLFGREEIEVIMPAIELMKKEGYDVHGPFPADVVFMRAFDGEYDAVVSMYHDQGQIALKLRGFEAVTIAGGQPYPIVTPAHGTAFDIAGRGIASTKATEKALDLLGKMLDANRSF